MFIIPFCAYCALCRICVRRLIIIAACGLVLAPGPARTAPVGLVDQRTGTAHAPAFCLLIDPLKHFAANALEPMAGPLPRISVPGLYDPVFRAPSPAPSLEDPINAAHPCNRVVAPKSALDNLPEYARRLARWQARRSLVLLNRPENVRVPPFRPGRPSGHHARHVHDIDDVLCECHALALDARELHDTS
jgi:hypothetical protein